SLHLFSLHKSSLIINNPSVQLIYGDSPILFPFLSSLNVLTFPLTSTFDVHCQTLLHPQHIQPAFKTSSLKIKYLMANLCDESPPGIHLEIEKDVYFTVSENRHNFFYTLMRSISASLGPHSNRCCFSVLLHIFNYNFIHIFYIRIYWHSGIIMLVIP